ncbi:MAG: ABC-2 transporter permease [Spirochaetaceae bacterium]|nr:ABC-2 transporter permease [Spirochaetaceae bacterium]
MKNMQLLRKELMFNNNFTTAIWIICLIAMQLIPSYPVYIGPFYITLCIMLSFAMNQTSHDILYTVLLPVRKIDTVKARFIFCGVSECLAIVISAIIGAIRLALHFPLNDSGINLNVAYLGFQLIIFAVFNMIFLGNVYRNPLKCGLKYFIAAFVYFLVYTAFELPVWNFMGKLKELDIEKAAFTPAISTEGWTFFERIGAILYPLDGGSLVRQLPVLGVGIVIYALSWPITFHWASRQFEKYDI